MKAADKNKSGFTVAQHERYHAWLCKDAFNKAAEKANAYEGKYCSGCGDKAKRLALAIMRFAREEQNVANNGFDRDDYGGGELNESEKRLYNSEKKELDEARDDYNKSKCKKL